MHRVIEPRGVLPQAAWRLDTDTPLGEQETLIAVERLNLDAASYRQLNQKHAGDGDAIRAEVLEIIETRGKMHNPVTGSGGMLIGTVQQLGSLSPLQHPPVALVEGDRIATLISLTLTPLRITDALASWDGLSEQVPCHGQAILFGRTIAAKLPTDLSPELALAVMDVCGAPALTHRVVTEHRERLAGSGRAPVVAVIGGAGKSGSLSLAAAQQAGAARTIAVVPVEPERERLEQAGLADAVVLADARDPMQLAEAVIRAGGPADVTVVCVDVPGCEHGAILATAERGSVIFFSMATSFSSAALGAEGFAADVELLIGNGYTPGHAELALELLRSNQGVRRLFEARLDD